MNGWMKGKKENSGEIGMFPAIYVEEITQISLEMPVPSQGHYGLHSFPVVD
jgi:hypothetical protein